MFDMKNKLFVSKSSLLLLLVTQSWLSFAGPKKELSIEQAIEAGINASKNLQLSASKLDLIRNRTEQIKNSMVPTLNLSSQYMRISDNIDPLTLQMNGQNWVLNPQILNQYHNKASINYALFTGFKLVNTLDNIKRLEQASHFDVEKDRVEIKHNIIKAYFGLQKLLQSQEPLLQSIAAADSRLQDINQLISNGMALPIDAQKAELTQQQLKMALSELQTNIAIQRYQFNILIGLPEDNQDILSTQANPQNISESETAFLERAFKNRSDLQAITIRTQAAQSQMKVVKANMYPVFSLYGNTYLSNPNQRMFPPENKFKGTWDAGAMITWNPSALITTKAQIQEAKLNTSQLHLSKDILADGIKTEVHTAFQQYKLSVDKINLARQWKEYATENVKVLKSRVDNGMNVISDLTDADTTKVQAEINLVNAQIEATLAYYQLLKSTGE